MDKTLLPLDAFRLKNYLRTSTRNTKAPFQDLAQMMELLLAEHIGQISLDNSVNLVDKIDHATLDTLLKFLSKMAPADISSGLLHICRAYLTSEALKPTDSTVQKESAKKPAQATKPESKSVESKASSSVVHRLLLQVTCLLDPNALFKIVDELPVSQASIEKLVWILSQATVTIDGAKHIHPAGIEFWFARIFPLLQDSSVDSQVAEDLLDCCIDYLSAATDTLDIIVCKSKNRSNPALIPVVGISSFISFMQFVQLKHKADPNVMLLYLKFKNLMFSTDSQIILTNRPSVVFAALVTPLQTDLNSGVMNEILSIIALSIAGAPRKAPDSILTAWVQHYEEFIPETRVIVYHLLSQKYSTQRLHYGQQLVWTRV